MSHFILSPGTKASASALRSRTCVADVRLFYQKPLVIIVNFSFLGLLSLLVVFIS